MILLGEAGTAEDIANGALFLASDEARHITGAELVIECGMTIIQTQIHIQNKIHVSYDDIVY